MTTCLKGNLYFKSFLISCELRSSSFNQSVLMCSHEFTLEFQPQSMQNSSQVGIVEWRWVSNLGHHKEICSAGVGGKRVPAVCVLRRGAGVPRRRGCLLKVELVHAKCHSDEVRTLEARKSLL